MELEQRRSPTTAFGLYTNESFKILLDYEVARARRYPCPMTVLHLAAEPDESSDEVKAMAYQVVSDILSRILRVTDIPTQLGEEFVILLPATDEAGGRALAERILLNVRTRQDFPTDKLFQMRLYVGLASRFMDSKTASQELLAEAAVAMNEARVKQAGSYIAFSDIEKDIPKPPKAS